MKYLRIPWGMRAMKELGLTPALCHPDHTMLFPAEKIPERKKPPESLWAALICTPNSGHPGLGVFS